MNFLIMQINIINNNVLKAHYKTAKISVSLMYVIEN